jgi:hypothetical protein
MFIRHGITVQSSHIDLYIIASTGMITPTGGPVLSRNHWIRRHQQANESVAEDKRGRSSPESSFDAPALSLTTSLLDAAPPVEPLQTSGADPNSDLMSTFVSPLHLFKLTDDRVEGRSRAIWHPQMIQ